MTKSLPCCPTLVGVEAPYLTVSDLQFDTCDPARHFSIEVPKRAHHLPLLAYSILAYSARQVSLTTGVDKNSHSSYYSHALRILIPIFDNPSEAQNENVLAAIVILRSYEEMFGWFLSALFNGILTRVCRG